MGEEERHREETPELQRWIDRFRTPPPEYASWSRIAAPPAGPGSAARPDPPDAAPPADTG